MSTASLLQITGDKRLIRKLERLRSSGSNRVTTSALRKGLTIIARGIRSEIPARLKTVRRTIGTGFRKVRRQGEKQAKAGLSVGKKRASKPPKRSSRGGVGISANNVHWWALGTGPRSTKSGRSTGRMAANDAVGRGYRKSESAAVAAIRKAVKEGLAREARRG